MRIQEWPQGQGEILAALNGHGLSYDETNYSGLVMPGSVVIDTPTASRLHSDVGTVWKWLENYQHLYRESIEGNSATDPLLQASEWDLDSASVALQRQAAYRNELPLLGRIDSVAIAPTQQIAEIQWKGGGEGFIAAIDATYRSLFPQQDTQPLGELAANWGRIFRAAAGHNEPLHVLNTGRAIWGSGEAFLRKEVQAQGIEWSFLPAKEVAQHLTVQAGRLCLQQDGASPRPVDFMYLDRLTEVIPPDLLTIMGRVAAEGKLRLDPPASYLYNQKVGLALPFNDQYRDSFDDDIREILIPSVLVSDAQPNCEPIIPYITHEKRDLLAEVQAWEDLLRLPRNIREQLVLKCASTHQYDNHGGHGVLRLWGSAKVAAESLNTVLHRVRADNEPWILQPYIDQKWDVPLAHPGEINAAEQVKAHARFGLYCGYTPGQAHLLGGIATFSPFWKVAGKTAGRDKQHNLTGSAFTDIRVGH